MRHPEQRDGEVYLGNATIESFHHQIGWRSKRMGLVAIDSRGERMQQSGSGWCPKYYPAFASREEMGESLAAALEASMNKGFEP